MLIPVSWLQHSVCWCWWTSWPAPASSTGTCWGGPWGPGGCWGWPGHPPDPSQTSSDPEQNLMVLSQIKFSYYCTDKIICEKLGFIRSILQNNSIMIMIIMFLRHRMIPKRVSNFNELLRMLMNMYWIELYYFLFVTQ